MRIRTLQAIGVAVPVAALAALAIAFYMLGVQASGALARNTAADAIIDGVFRRSLLVQDYLLTGTPRAREQLVAAHEHLASLYDDVALAGPELAGELERMRTNYRKVRQLLDDLLPLRDGSSPVHPASDVERHLVGQLLVLSQDNVARASRLAARTREELVRAIDSARTWGAGVTLAVVLVLCATWALLGATLLPRLRRLHAGIDALARGDRDHRVRLRGDDEVAEVARAFDAMAERLGRSQRALVARGAELEAANAEMDAFVYTVSHDLRAPLRAVDGFSQALVEDFSERLDGDALTYLRFLREGAQEMEALIDALLRLSRTTRGELACESVDLAALAREAIAVLAAAEPARHVEARIAGGLEARGDPRLLRTVVENLVGNAWKFTRGRDGACIEVGGERGATDLHCFVRDNGAGFDMRYSQKLFRPFQRLHAVTEFEGTGIGLASVQRIVARHGGRVWAEGSPGEGATFHFRIPWETTA